MIEKKIIYVSNIHFLKLSDCHSVLFSSTMKTEYRIKIIIIFTLCLVDNGQSLNPRLISNPNDVDLILQKVPCIYHLCQKYFKSKHSLQGSLVILYITPNGSPFQRKLIKTLSDDPKYEWALMVKHSGRKHANASHVQDKAKNYFFLIKNSTEIHPILKQARTLPTWNPYAQVLILLLDDLIVEKRNIEIHSIFEILLEKEMLNVNVIYSIYGTAKVQTETWLPYGNKSCARTVSNVLVIDECENNNETLKATPIVEVGNKIPENLVGCELRVSAATNWPPYSKFDFKTFTFRGIEVQLVKTLGEILEMKISIMYDNQTRANRVNGPEFYANILEG